MATWDGSFVDQMDEQQQMENFYINRTNQNQHPSSSSSSEAWNYFYSNDNPQSQLMNLPKGNDHLNNQPFFYSNNAENSKNLPFFRNNYPKQNNGRQRMPNKYYSYQDLARGSNLLPTAVEFVPNHIRHNQKPKRNEDLTSNFENNMDFGVQNDLPRDYQSRQNGLRNYKKNYKSQPGNQKYQYNDQKFRNERVRIDNWESGNSEDVFETESLQQGKGGYYEKNGRYNNWGDKRSNSRGNFRERSKNGKGEKSANFDVGQEKDQMNWRLKDDQSPQPKNNFQPKSKKYEPGKQFLMHCMAFHIYSKINLKFYTHNIILAERTCFK